MPLLARLSEEARTDNARASQRRTLSLRVPALSSGPTAVALIHNLSEHGLRIETEAPLRVDEIIQVELPETGPIDAKVVWTGESSVGCRFLAPVSKAAVSAALLRSSPRNMVPANELRVELPLISVERAQQLERAEMQYEHTDHSNAATFVALLISLVVSGLFVAALLRMALLS